MALLSRIREHLRKRRETADPRVAVRVDGFDIRSPDDQALLAQVDWSRVTRISTYKLDLLTTDCICVLFEQAVPAQPVQISEEWDGFADLLGALPRAFPSVAADWYVQVMQPPFEKNRTILFDSEGRDNAAV